MNEIAIRNDALPAKVEQQRREISTPPDDATLQRVVEMIVGSYPNASPSDPKTYLRALRAKLKSYPAVVVAKIADPQSGIVTVCRFPPTIAEIDEFAKPIVVRMRAALERDRGTVKMLEARKCEIEGEERIAEGLRGLASSLKARQAVRDTDAQRRRDDLLKRSQGTPEQVRASRIEAGIVN